MSFLEWVFVIAMFPAWLALRYWLATISNDYTHRKTFERQQRNIRDGIDPFTIREDDHPR